MLRLVKKIKLKRVVSSLLLVVMLLGVFPSIEVKADSNSLRETYIDLMSGASAVNATDIESLTVNDLRCIALYLSNFYVPYNTSLDEQENKEASMNNMINSLKNIGFKDDSAQTLVNAVYSASLSSCKQLYFCPEDLFGSDVYVGSGGDHLDPGYKSAEVFNNANYPKYVGNKVSSGGREYIPMTMFTFLGCMDGVYHFFEEEGADASKGLKLYWGDNTSFTPAFEFNQMTSTIVSSMVESIGHGSGLVGNGLVSTNIDDWVAKSEVERPLLANVTQKLYVDWVGNIICDFGTTRVVIYPACVNPYAFGGIDDAEVKSRFNMMSTWGQFVLNSRARTFSTGSYHIDEVGTMGIDMVLERGNTEKLSYANGFNWGTENQKQIKAFLESCGFETGCNKEPDNKHGEGEGGFNYDSFALDLTADNSIYEFMQYATISNENIQNLTGGSVFAVYNTLESDFKAFSENGKFSSMSDNFSAYMQFNTSDYAVLRNLFLTYAFAYNNRNKSAFDADCYVHFKFNSSNFPESLDTSIVWENLNTDNEKIVSFIYYLLHPTEGVRYVATLVKNKLSGILVSWHEDVVGATDSNSTTGMTQYLGFTGYVTSPSLNEVSWIRNIMDWYDNIVVYLIILMGVILLCYILTGHMTIARAVVGVLLFGVLAFLPPIAISSVVDSINDVCDTIYSDKFDYWSYTQLQTYLGGLSSLESEKLNTVNDYINRLMELETNSEIENKNGFSGVKLKWMSPKKVYEEAGASDELHNKLDFSSTMISMLTSSLSATNRSEEYVDAVGATYLYRDFTDIYMYASKTYNLMTTYNHDNTLNTNTSLKIVDSVNDSGGAMFSAGSNWGSSSVLGAILYPSLEHLNNYVMANNELAGGYSSIPEYIRETSSLSAIRRGFINNNVGIGSGKGNYYTHNGNFATSCILSYTDVIRNVNKNYRQFQLDLGYDVSTNNATSGRKIKVNKNNFDSFIYGLDLDTFDYSLNDFKDDSLSLDQNSASNMSSHAMNVEAKRKDLSSMYYSLYVESPFYYFNNVFRDFVSTHSSEYVYNPQELQGATNNVYPLFVDDNQRFFFNLEDGAGDGYGELRDFMNMHDLFYYVIPVLDDGNKLADLFDAVYGMHINSDMQLQITSAGKIKYGGREYASIRAMSKSDATIDENGNACSVWDTMTDEEMYKFWHDYNVWTIFNSYVPWIDTMEDCVYARPETISVLGERYTVLNPLDPTSYFRTNDAGELIEGRYMIFSRSEMAYYGLDMSDLTEVERKIIKVQDNVYDKSLDLMNYYTLADEVLINGFAMIQTFEFNKEFSESNLVGSSYIMYPQGYEAKAFSYDAYLRLVVAEASGEPIQIASSDGETSIYRRILKNTSLFFGFFLLVNDVMSVYIIPCLKLAFLIMLFFISVSLIIASAIKLELNIISVVWKSVLSPLGAYWILSVGFAWLVSLFMSNGASGVTDTSTTISVGDPTTVIIIMIVINTAVIILLFKICKKCFKDLKTYLLSVIDSISATAVGAMKRVAGVALAGKAYHTMNKMANGIASTASQRGRANVDVVGGASSIASGVGSALAGGMAGFGLGAHAASSGNVTANSVNALEASLKDAGQSKQNKFDVVANNAQKDIDAIEAKRKKSGYERSEDARQAAMERANKGKEDMLKGDGLRNKVSGAKDFVAGSMGAKYNELGNAVRNKVGLGADGKVTKARQAIMGNGLSNDDRRNLERLHSVQNEAKSGSIRHNENSQRKQEMLAKRGVSSMDAARSNHSSNMSAIRNNKAVAKSIARHDKKTS